MKCLSSLRKFRNKRGSEMVEAAISVPVIFLTAMLLVRLFTFYLEILSTGLNEHEKALEAWDEWRGHGLKVYTSHTDIRMMRGGVLPFDLVKKIDTRAYFINEDLMVRAGEVL